MRLGVYIPNITDGTSFYRGHGWTSEIHKIDSSIRVEYFNQPDVLKLKGLDAVFIQRPDNEQELKFIRSCKKIGIPVIIDFDDLLFEVPEYNRYYIVMDLAQNDYKTNVINALTLADIVFTSTEELKNQLIKYNKNVHTVRNAWDDYYCKPVKEYNKTNVILWRGSSTHREDLKLYEKELTEIIRANEDFKFIFLADKLFDWQKQLIKEVKNMHFMQAVPVFEYYFTLMTLKPAMVWVTLEDTLFNRCKSDVAVQEAKGCGAVSLAPDWEEWQDAEFKYNTKADFVARFNEILKGLKNNNLQFNKIDVRLLSETNKQRVELIKGLVK